MLEYDNNYIRRLIQLDLIGGLSPEEKGKLEDWINESEEHRLLFCKIKKQLSINEIKNVREKLCKNTEFVKFVN